MRRFLFLANAVLTLPFGIAALIAPGAVFAGFGIGLDPGAMLIARGYAAACLGYGILFLLLNKRPEAQTARALLAASVLFNLVETVIQAIGGATHVAAPGIWATVVAHGLMALLSLRAVFKT